MQEGVWEIFHSENLKSYKSCICGHRVKRISFLYDRFSKKTMYIGTTCLKKYGISNHVKNRILIEVLKETLLENDDLEETVRTWIQKTYSAFRNKINGCSHGEFDYYDIVAPFRRLLNDVCELVTEYDFDLILLLKEIERDVESMNESTKHHMIDEIDSDIESSISLIDYDDDGDDDDNVTHDILSVSDNFVETIIGDDNISEYSAETPSDNESDDTYSIASSEFSIDTIIEDGDKPLPIAIADPFCNDPNCHPKFHCYCKLKFRLDRLQKGIAEHHRDIHTIRIEMENVLEDSQNFWNCIREHREFALNYIAERRVKLDTNIYVNNIE